MAIDWLTWRPEGFYCIPGDFYIDPKASVPTAVVSHAHADHYPRGLNVVHATAPTLAIGKTRYREKAGKTLHAHSENTPFQVNGVEISFLPAGHMLGSAQILMKFQNQSILYSGDFSLKPNATCASLAYPDCPIDLLVCESTFGEKEVHSQPETAMRMTLQSAGLKPLLIAVYPLGKAQHVTHLLNVVAPELPVMLHYEVFRYHQVYENHGFKPGRYEFYRRMNNRSRMLPHALLVTPKVMASYSKDIDYHKVMATGWDAKSKMPYLNGLLDISDHVDSQDLRTYISQISPKEVWFWHGYPKRMIEWCVSKGISAQEIKHG